MIIETDALLGREEERAAIGRLYATLDGGPAALVLEGEPGIGKTALFEHGVAQAQAHGFKLLVAAPTSAESSLSFVGLTDLLSEAHGLFAELPSPQRHALEVALLLDEGADSPLDPRAIGMGMLGVLRALAASSPVVVAVDDLQWLDLASAAALAFAFRRVTNEPIGLLAALRTGEDAPADLAGYERVSLGPLSVGAIHALLAERLQLSTPRSLLLRIHHACRGNPLFALEIGRALQERGLPEPGQPFEIPTDAETLFAARLDELPDQTLDALAVAAVIASPTRSFVGASALGPALRANIIRLEGERIHFTHPLLASAAYARLDLAAKHELHRSIATAVRDPEERARHLALAAEEPDGDVAAALDEATEQAAHRGAPAAASELAELAVKLTPSEDSERSRIRRRLAAQHHFAAGDVARAREILEQLIEELSPGTERARALLQLSLARISDDAAAARSLCEQALLEGTTDDQVLVAIHRHLAGLFQLSGNRERALAESREALRVAERTEDARLIAPSLTYVAFFELWGGQVTPGLLERALQLEPQAGYLRLYEGPLAVDGLRLMMLEDDLDAARERLSRAERIARDHGDEDARIALLLHLAELECRSGRFDHAARWASDGYALTDQLGVDGDKGALLYVVAFADALRGRTESAREAAQRGLALTEKAGHELYTVHNLRVLGFLALSTGDWPTAARILGPLPERLAARGYGQASTFRIVPDAIEALILAGQPEAAAAPLEQLEQTARTLDIAWVLARSARCRGLLAAAECDYDAAFPAFEDALAAHQRLPDPLERGRTLLALGQTQRRTGRRREARETLQQALAIFEEIGAALWAEQARAELARLGGRTPSDALTGAEERVAHLVAEGKTNREVAAALFVTERTVETHLSSVYRKLDLRSRSELASHLAASRTS